MRLIDGDKLLDEFDRLDLDYGAMGGVAECIAITEGSPTIEPDKSRPYGDCAKCIHEYGTLGCCTTVSNEWVYDCDNGMAQYEITKAEPSKSIDQNRADVPIGETISRADAIEVGNKIVEELALSSLDWDALKHWAKELFDALPSADRPQVKYNSAEEQTAETCDKPKGEWKWTHGGQCSECGFHNTNFDFNFCPNCGADMRGADR